jgi:serine/threonine protein kinase
MSDLVGQQWGNYRLTRLLGQGGFAEVYLGQHIWLNMFAAIKILHTHLSEEGIEGFQHEAQVIAELVHPHIVRVLDFDVKEGVPFLVLDYAANGSLRQRHPHSTRLPLNQVVHYVKQVASALQYAHDRKTIHRDVKPENMLLGPDDTILLSDFGIATIAHSTSSMRAQASLGTISYMAPEQIQSHPRPASDQYALAVVTYQWLTGEFPFQGSAPEVIAKHLGATPPSIRAKMPDLPAGVEHVIMTALAKDPKARFGSIQDFATALEQASHQSADLLTSPVQSFLPSEQPFTELPTIPATFAFSTPVPSSQNLSLENIQKSSQPNVAPEQPSSPYLLFSSPQQGHPSYPQQISQEEINMAMMQALILGVILVAIEVVLVLASKFVSVAVFIGLHFLVYAVLNFFAGRQTARKTGEINLSLLTCFLANSAYLTLLFIGYALFPYALYVRDIYFIVLALLLDLGIGALGGVVGRKQARKKVADLSPQPSRAASPSPMRSRID